MNYSRLVLTRGFPLVFALFVALAVYGTATHATSETWTGQLPLQRRIVNSSLSAADAARAPDCIKGGLRVLAPGIQYPNENKIVQSDCWHYTDGGVYGVSSGLTYIRMGTIGSGSMTDAYYGTHELVGNRLLRKFTFGSSSGIRIYEKPAMAARFSQYNSQAYVVFDVPGAVGWTLMEPGTTEIMRIGYHATSPNGKWLVVEAAGRLIRVNLETREMTPFTTRVLPYGNGQNPTYSMAISNDGRYVAVAGGNVTMQEVYFHDLGSCDISKMIGLVASGCQSRSIKTDMVGADTAARVSNLYFNPTADTLFFSTQEGGVWKRYGVSPAGTAEHLIEYLALGDSYSSGEGDGEGWSRYEPGTDGDGASVASFQTGITDYPYAAEKCHISRRSYPYILAANAQLLDGQFHSVACSGADVNDVLNTATDGQDVSAFNGHFNQLDFLDNGAIIQSIKERAIASFVPGRAAQIEFVATYKPRAVTIGIGGNDLHFSDILQSCIVSSETCSYATTDRAKTANEIETTIYDRLVSTYTDLKKASPTTQFYAVGYPYIFTTGDSCGINVHLDMAEREYAIFTIQYLNKAVRAAASAAGVTYIDIENSLQGSNLCSGVQYPSVNGLTKGNDTLYVLGNETYHPNEDGHAKIAAAIRAQLSDGSIVTSSPCVQVGACPSGSFAMPSRPTYFGVSSPAAISSVSGTFVLQGVPVDRDGIRQVSVEMSSSLLRPNATVTTELHSTPVPLNNLYVDANQRIVGTLTLPLGIELGYHTIHLKVPLITGETIDVYDWIFVRASANDTDGDGIDDAADACPFVVPSGDDSDADHIDDACDGMIGPAPIVAPTPSPEPVNPVPSAPITSQPIDNGATLPTRPAVLASVSVSPAAVAMTAPVETGEIPNILQDLRAVTDVASSAPTSAISAQVGDISANNNATHRSVDVQSARPAADYRWLGVIAAVAIVVVLSSVSAIRRWRRGKNSVS